MSRTAMARGRVAAATVLLAALAVTGCGYALVGRGNSLPAYIRIIGVPAFENQTAIENVDALVTEEVRREFQSRGSLRTVPEIQGADAVLKGIITSVRIEPVSINADIRATRYVVIVTANVEFIDQRDGGKVLWSNPSMIAREEVPLDPDIEISDPASVFRGNQSALLRLSAVFARSVVTSILTGD